MKGTILTIPPSGNFTMTDVDTANIYQLLSKAVAGSIEQVPLFTSINLGNGEKPCVAFCNEEGKLQNLPLNEWATFLWSQAVNGKHLNDALVGTVVVVWGDREFMANL